MRPWLIAVLDEFRAHLVHAVHVTIGRAPTCDRSHAGWSRLTMIGAGVVLASGLLVASNVPAYRFVPPPEEQAAAVAMPIPEEPIDYTQPVREEPARFRANAKMPARTEGSTSVSIHLVPFDPEQDLVQLDDERVWWESDHDTGDTENDHVVHHALETPLRRVIELVSAEGGVLEVHDAYRDTGIHTSRSLHKQGRAVDLTCDELGLERLAKLCWAAGFDWVYYEAPRKGGHHIHASVRP